MPRPSRSKKVEVEEDYAEEESSESDDDDEEEEELEKKELPQRSTRGRRIQKLEEDEADVEFWNQDAWREIDEEDDDVKSSDFTSDDFADSADSDIDLDENAEIQQEQADAAAAALDAKAGGKRQRREEEEDDAFTKKKKSKYVDPALVVRAKQQRQISPKVKKFVRPLPARSIELRASTKLSSSQHHHNQTILTEVEASKKKKKKKSQQLQPSQSEVSVPQLTHMELLEEASKTEFENKRVLQEMLVLQEEQKKRRELEEGQKQDKGPRIIFQSSAQGDFITYTDPSAFPQPSKLPSNKIQSVCALTKQPAKYRMADGKLTPFASVLAYKKLKGVA